MKTNTIIRLPSLHLVAGLSAALLAINPSAQAATWQSGGGDNNWNNVGNWGTGGIPDTAAETATFTTSGSTNPTIGISGTQTIQQVVYNGDTNFTITGAGKDVTTLRLDAANGVGITGTTGAWTTQTFSGITVDLNDSAGAATLSRLVLGDGKTVVFDSTSRFVVSTDLYYGTSTGGSSTITFNGDVVLNRDLKRGSDALAPAGTGSTTINLNATSWSGTSDLYVGGVGSTALTTANIQNGVLGTNEIRIGNDGNVVQITNSDITTSAAALVFNNSFNNAIANATSGTFAATYASGTSTWTGGILLANGSVAKTNTFHVANAAATLVVSGSIGLGQAINTTVQKTGAGTLVLSNSNNNFGATVFNVVGGTLLAGNGTTGSATSTASVVVKTGATLGGSGLITPGAGKSITVEAGGQIAAGAAASGFASLHLSGASTSVSLLTMASDAEFTFELGSLGNNDQVEFWNYAGASDFTLNNNAVNIVDAGGLEVGTYVLFEFYSNSGTTLTNSGISSGLVLGDTPAGFSGSIQYNSNNISLVVTAVPEPGAAALLGAGLTTILVFRRRRQP